MDADAGRGHGRPPPRSANIHDLTLGDLLEGYVAHSHDINHASEGNVDDDSPAADDEASAPTDTTSDTATRQANAVSFWQGNVHQLSDPHGDVPPSDVRKILSGSYGLKPEPYSSKVSRLAPPAPSPPPGNYSAKHVTIASESVYSACKRERTGKGALVDRGANGFIAGADVTVIELYPGRYVDVNGIDDHRLPAIQLGTVGGVVNTQLGDVIFIFQQAAIHGKGASIISAVQLEHFKVEVNDRSIKLGGLQRLATPDGYVAPLNIADGLSYLIIRPFTKREFDTLPHTICTADTWDTRCVDLILSDRDDWYDAVGGPALPADHRRLFDMEGNFLHRVVQQHDVDLHFFDAESGPTIAAMEAMADVCALYHSVETDFLDTVDACSAPNVASVADDDPDPLYQAHKRTVAKRDPDYAALRPYLGWLPIDIVKPNYPARPANYNEEPLAGYPEHPANVTTLKTEYPLPVSCRYGQNPDYR